MCVFVCLWCLSLQQLVLWSSDSLRDRVGSFPATRRDRGSAKVKMGNGGFFFSACITESKSVLGIDNLFVIWAVDPLSLLKPSSFNACSDITGIRENMPLSLSLSLSLPTQEEEGPFLVKQQQQQRRDLRVRFL